MAQFEDAWIRSGRPRRVLHKANAIDGTTSLMDKASPRVWREKCPFSGDRSARTRTSRLQWACMSAHEADMVPVQNDFITIRAHLDETCSRILQRPDGIRAEYLKKLQRHIAQFFCQHSFYRTCYNLHRPDDPRSEDNFGKDSTSILRCASFGSSAKSGLVPAKPRRQC